MLDEMNTDALIRMSVVNCAYNDHCEHSLFQGSSGFL